MVNAAAPTAMAVDLGSVVKLMAPDTLSGRSPLYLLERFAGSPDTGLLLGKQVSPGAFNDTTLGRAMDAMCEYGAEQLFSQIALSAASFPSDVDMREKASGILREAEKVEYFCSEDAEAVAARLRREGSPHHFCCRAAKEKATYLRGRPPKNGEREVSKVAYVSIKTHSEQIQAFVAECRNSSKNRSYR